jgi:hypothetical protein
MILHLRMQVELKSTFCPVFRNTKTLIEQNNKSLNRLPFLKKHNSSKKHQKYNLIILLVFESKPISTEVPEKIKKWREEQLLRLQDKDAAEEKAKEALRKQAEKELEDWYKRHEETIAKTKTLNR